MTNVSWANKIIRCFFFTNQIDIFKYLDNICLSQRVLIHVCQCIKSNRIICYSPWMVFKPKDMMVLLCTRKIDFTICSTKIANHTILNSSIVFHPNANITLRNKLNGNTKESKAIVIEFEMVKNAHIVCISLLLSLLWIQS